MQKAIEESKKTAKQDEVRRATMASANPTNQDGGHDEDDFDVGLGFDKFAGGNNSGFDNKNQ